MKRAFLIPLIVLLVSSLACSLTGTRPTAAPVVATKEVGTPEKATVPPAQPEAKPTGTKASPAKPAPTEAPTTEAPSAEAPGKATEAEETFDTQSGNWSDPFIVTTQASGRDPRFKVTVDGGLMRIAISEKETYLYSFYTRELAGASTIEADYQLKGALNTGIALVCKANEERTSWFELRVSAGNSSYNLYRYDKKLKEEQSKNPYVLLGKGVMKVEQYYPTKPNHIVLTCADNTLSIDINSGKLKASHDIDVQLDGTTMGLGVMSADVLPGTVDFDKVLIH